MNNGTCTDGVDSFTCNCVDGFTKENCATNIDDCDPSPCMNNGTCPIFAGPVTFHNLPL